MPIRNLTTHTAPYVSVAGLASYWRVNCQQLYKQIEAGTLPAIRLGPGIYRISTTAAREFEERARISPIIEAGTSYWRTR